MEVKRVALGMMLCAALGLQMQADETNTDRKALRKELASVYGKMGARKRRLCKENDEARTLKQQMTELKRKQAEVDQQIDAILQQDAEYKKLCERRDELRLQLKAGKEKQAQTE